MNTPINSLAKYISEQFGLILGENLFITKIPSNTTASQVLWLVQNGSSISKELFSYEKVLQYNYTLYVRGKTTKEVIEKSHEISVILNKLMCPKIDGFQVYDLKCRELGANPDPDSQERYKASVQIALRLFESYN